MDERPHAKPARDVEAYFDLLAKNLLLANAGGITATLLMVGPLLQNKVFTKLIAFPLGFFLLGAIAVFLGWWSELATAMYRVGNTHPVVGLLFQRKIKLPYVGGADMSIMEAVDKFSGTRAIFLPTAAVLFLCGAASGCGVILTR